MSGNAASSYERIMANLDTIERNLRAINRQRSIINFLAGVGVASIFIDVVRWF